MFFYVFLYFERKEFALFDAFEKVDANKDSCVRIEEFTLPDV
ncbi:MAG TPA: hypothetical protein PLA81_10975 [Syntrophorhabdaceae bacterium]|jgi:hypothetical protein|nr:hypothetical protein [Syntrophorhabdaceae bacterium]